MLKSSQKTVVGKTVGRLQQGTKKIPRRFPPPWSVEEGDNYFVVRDREGQQFAYVHFDNPRVAAKPLTRDEARRIDSNIAKLPEFLQNG